MWDQEALDLVVPAHITFEASGLGEMELIAIGASIDYRVEQGDGSPIVEFSWSGFDDGEPTSGRGRAAVEGDTMHGKLFIHQGDESKFVAKRSGLNDGFSTDETIGAKHRFRQLGGIPTLGDRSAWLRSALESRCPGG